MKTFKVKPAEVFALQFSDGKKIQMSFNTRSMSILAEMINNKKISLAGPEFLAAIVYAGAKAVNPDFTEEEANAVFIQLEESFPDALNGIIEEYCQASNIDMKEIKKNVVMNVLK